jgi:ribonuclease Z
MQRTLVTAAVPSARRGGIGAPLMKLRSYSRSPLTSAPSVVDNIHLTFLGTSSGAPSLTRNQQAMMMQLCGTMWLFDAGEATQHRIMQTTSSPSSVKRIFISHMHGDHVFGLPGMLCNMACSYGGGGDEPSRSLVTGDAKHPIVLVGPQGLRSWVRTALGNAYASLGSMHVQVDELVGLRAFGRGAHMPPPVHVDRPLPNEVRGLDIEPDADGAWHIPMRPEEPPVIVKAIELDHTVPTVGWVVTEKPRPGRLDADRVMPILQEHDIHPKVLRQFKDGQPIELPDGTVLRPEDYVSTPTSRKIAVLSDMRGFNPSANPHAEALLEGANLLIHESTNACLQHDRRQRQKLPHEIEASARAHGHSTPQMAGRLAKRVGAQNLVLTHFSPRYNGDTTRNSVGMMSEIRSLAQSAFGRSRVTTARDLMSVKVHIDGHVEIIEPERIETVTMRARELT